MQQLNLVPHHSRPDRLTKAGPRGKPCTGSTVNRYLASISALFEWAICEGYASTNPAHGVKRFNERGSAREVHLEASEARALVEACSEQFRPIVAFALGTGCRRNEILTLRWQDVRWAKNQVFIPAECSKTKRGRPVPLYEDLAGLLRREKRARASIRIDGSDSVFLRHDGSKWTWKAVQREFKAAVRRCAALLTRKATDLRFHHLRHSFATLAVQNGVPLETVSKLLGHVSIQTTMRYAHWCHDDRVKAAAVVGRLLRPSNSEENAKMASTVNA